MGEMRIFTGKHLTVLIARESSQQLNYKTTPTPQSSFPLFNYFPFFLLHGDACVVEWRAKDGWERSRDVILEYYS